MRRHANGSDLVTGRHAPRGGRDASQGAPAAAAEAEREASGATGLPGGLLRADDAAAQVRTGFSWEEARQGQKMFFSEKCVRFFVSIWQILEESRLHDGLLETNASKYGR